MSPINTLSITYIVLLCVWIYHANAFPLFHSSLPVPINHMNGNSNKPEMQSAENGFDFNTLKSLEDRCGVLSERESEYMLSFWSPTLKCFQLDPSMSASYGRISVTTTCLALGTILNNPSHWESLCGWEQSVDGSSRVICLKNVCEGLIRVPWRDEDFFQLAVLVDILGRLKAADITEPKLLTAINQLVLQRPKLSLHRNQKMSTYLRHLNAKALSSAISNNAISVDEDTRRRIDHAFRRANDVAFDELCRQIAFYKASDSANFDVVILVYSLVSYFQISTSYFMNTKTTGIVPQANMNLVAIALQIIFSEQAIDGTWRKGRTVRVIHSIISHSCCV